MLKLTPHGTLRRRTGFAVAALAAMSIGAVTWAAVPVPTPPAVPAAAAPGMRIEAAAGIMIPGVDRAMRMEGPGRIYLGPQRKDLTWDFHSDLTTATANVMQLRGHVHVAIRLLAHATAKPVGATDTVAQTNSVTLDAQSVVITYNADGSTEIAFEDGSALVQEGGPPPDSAQAH